MKDKFPLGNNPRAYSQLELIDNETLLSAHENWTELQGRIKENTRILDILKAAIIDSSNSTVSPSELEFLKSHYASTEEFNTECLPLYLKCSQLMESLTPRQTKILYHFLIDGFTLTAIARIYNISAAGVFKSISLIRKKAIKIGVNL